MHLQTYKYTCSYRNIKQKSSGHNYAQFIYDAYLSDTNSENRSVRPSNRWHDGPDLSEYEDCEETTLLEIMGQSGLACIISVTNFLHATWRLASRNSRELKETRRRRKRERHLKM